MTSEVIATRPNVAHASDMDTTSTREHATLDALHTPTRRSAQRLRDTLRLNAATSLMGGLVAAAAPSSLDQLLDTGHEGWVRVVGIGLVAYALGLLTLAGSGVPRLIRWTPSIVGADIAWVVASTAAIVVGCFSRPGSALVLAIGLAVGGFAWHQQHMLSGLRAADDLSTITELPPFEITAARTQIAAPASTMWAIITDHELYGRLAPNLGAVRATARNGPELTRTCTNRAGESWDETCTRWDPGHRFAVEVDTAHYPYPLQTMMGEWAVRPSGDGAEVSMRFAYQPRGGIRAAAFAAVMHAAFPLVLQRIVRGWRREARRVHPR
jgi:ribosome-associated toxin RatA of RatAB toxin-antitoxin module